MHRSGSERQFKVTVASSLQTSVAPPSPVKATAAIQAAQHPAPISDAELQALIASTGHCGAARLHARAIHALPYLRGQEQLLDIFQGGSQALVLLIYDPALQRVFVRKVEAGDKPRLADEIALLQYFASKPQFQPILRAYPNILASGRFDHNNAIFIDMEYVPGRNAGEWVLDGKGNVDALWEQLTPLLNIVMGVNKTTLTPEESETQLHEYVTRTIQRVQDATRIAREQATQQTQAGKPVDPYVQAFLQWVEQDTVIINDTAYTNPLHILREIKPGTPMWDHLLPHAQALVAHGDWTLLNTIIPDPKAPHQRRQHACLIDNRGLLKPSDLLFDLAKMLFSIESFVAISHGAYTLEVSPAKSPAQATPQGVTTTADHARDVPASLHFAFDESCAGIHVLHAAESTFFAFLAKQPSMAPIRTMEPHLNERIAFMAAAQNLADTPYRILDSTKATLADWCAATLRLNAWKAEGTTHTPSS